MSWVNSYKPPTLKEQNRVLYDYIYQPSKTKKVSTYKRKVDKNK